jgi:hypothetical protein
VTGVSRVAVLNIPYDWNRHFRLSIACRDYGDWTKWWPQQLASFLDKTSEIGAGKSGLEGKILQRAYQTEQAMARDPYIPKHFHTYYTVR